jgi:undecaprenyl-diphosphatase
VLGLVEGITEYLPVSSTGHLILTSALLGLDDPERKRAVDAFNIVIQGGAILAVAGLYRSRVAQMLLGVLGRNAAGRRLLSCLLVAFLPAALLGPLADDWIEAKLFHAPPVLAALALGGVWMIWLGRRGADGSAAADRVDPAPAALEALPFRHALAIGLFQCVAMWPGTSRSMMTIAGGTLLGLRPREAAEFSFLLGLPTLGAACLYKLASNLHRSAAEGTPNLFELLGVGSVVLGFVVATVSAALAVRWLVAFLTRHGLAAFGWYRLGLCAVLAGLVASGMLVIG